MNKPFSVIIRETKESLVSVINTSGLPLDVLQMILKELYNVVCNQAQLNYEQELKAYNEQENSDNGD